MARVTFLCGGFAAGVVGENGLSGFEDADGLAAARKDRAARGVDGEGFRGQVAFGAGAFMR
jgi:hypothetical protein